MLASSVKKPAYNNKIYKNNTLKDPTGLVDASYAGDLNKIVHIMTLENWNVDAPINGKLSIFFLFIKLGIYLKCNIYQQIISL